MATIRQFCAALRKDGFTMLYRDRSGGCTVTEFEKRSTDRKVSVQLWGDGKHRASHMRRINNDDRRWCGKTEPTDFTTLDGMSAAITFEFAR